MADSEFDYRPFCFLFSRRLYVGFYAWWLHAWQLFLSYRASLGTLTMPWGPSLTTTPCGSSLGGSRNSTTFLRDTLWRSERATHFGRVSSISGHQAWFSEPQALMSLWVSTPHKGSQKHFFSHLPVVLDGFPFRNYVSSYFHVRQMRPGGLKWLAQACKGRS